MTTYLALLDGGRREVEIDVVRRGPSRYEVRVGEEVLSLDAAAVDGATRSLLVGARSEPVALDARGTKVTARLRGGVHALEVLDERAQRLRRGAARPPAAGRQALATPVPGRVARVLVKVGDAVRAGQALVVVDATRLEDVLRSPRDGRVVELNVEPGQPVGANATLCAVE